MFRFSQVDTTVSALWPRWFMYAFVLVWLAAVVGLLSMLIPHKVPGITAGLCAIAMAAHLSGLALLGKMQDHKGQLSELTEMDRLSAKLKFYGPFLGLPSILLLLALLSLF